MEDLLAMWREKFPAISRLEDNKRCAPIGWISYMAVAGLAIWHRHEHRPHAGPDRAAILGDRERIRQIEAKALRKLKHPRRSRVLRTFLDS